MPLTAGSQFLVASVNTQEKPGHLLCIKFQCLVLDSVGWVFKYCVFPLADKEMHLASLTCQNVGEDSGDASDAWKNPKNFHLFGGSFCPLFGCIAIELNHKY